MLKYTEIIFKTKFKAKHIIPLNFDELKNTQDLGKTIQNEIKKLKGKIFFNFNSLICLAKRIFEILLKKS